MRILVTGGAGYIGSHLVDLLLRGDHEVSVIDNLSTGAIDNLAPMLDRIRFLNGSILDATLVSAEVERAQLVFHLAAAVGVRHIVDRPLDSIRVNTRGTEIVLECCFRYWRRALVASTSEVYGKTTTVPMSEDDDRVLGSTKVHRWAYSTSKALDEHLAFAYAALGLPISVVRYFNSYGPRLDSRGYGSVVASFIGKALAGEPILIHGDGSQTRSFTYIDDTTRGTFLAATSDAALGTVFNIGNPVETSILTLAERIRSLVGSSSEIRFVTYEDQFGPRFEDTDRRVPNVSRAKELLGWEPTIGLDDGLARTLEWWKTKRG